MKKTLFLMILSSILSFLFSKEICFNNFQKNICGNFRVLNQLIIKSELSKQELIEKIDSPLQQLTYFEDFNIYLKKSLNPISESKKLSKLDFITYAQPDISQNLNLNIKQKFQNNRKTLQSNIDSIVKKLWLETKGQGIKIAIIDDGFELNHEDLKNLKLEFQFDVDNKITDASPKLKIDTHGTQVLGIIFGQHNNIGIDGIAPESELIAIRQTLNITSDTILSFTIAQLSKANIINCSWNSPVLLEPIFDVIREVTKNSFVVFSAGNNHQEIRPFSIEASISEVITIGANANFSNFGELVDIYFPSRIFTTNIKNSYNYFNGTSASAPIFTGILALMLSQNRGLNINEVLERLKSKI